MKSNFFIKISLIAILLGVLNSCSKDELLSDAEINAQKIQSVINNEDIGIIVIYQLNEPNIWVESISSLDFKINKTFIRFENVYYNLEKLLRYVLNDSNNGGILKLYFN